MKKQHLFLMQCKHGCEKEYKERHKQVFPELLASLKRVGVSNYNIFMEGTQIYAYMEVDDFDKAMDELAKDPANQKWQEYMGDVMVTDENGTVVKVIDDRVFFLE